MDSEDQNARWPDNLVKLYSSVCLPFGKEQFEALAQKQRTAVRSAQLELLYFMIIPTANVNANLQIELHAQDHVIKDREKIDLPLAAQQTLAQVYKTAGLAKDTHTAKIMAERFVKNALPVLSNRVEKVWGNSL